MVEHGVQILSVDQKHDEFQQIGIFPLVSDYTVIKYNNNIYFISR